MLRRPQQQTSLPSFARSAARGGRAILVCDAPATRRRLAALVAGIGFSVEALPARDALVAGGGRIASGPCVVLIAAARVTERVRRLIGALGGSATVPVVVVAQHASVAAAVSALKAGAIDFLEQPVRRKRLLAAIDAAVAFQARASEAAARRAHFEELQASLTPRERQVMAMLFDGKGSKEIAAALGVSPRTVDGHRRSILRRMDVASTPELLGFALRIA